MNREQLRAVLWLRWRLLVRQSHRAGPVSAALFIVFAYGVLCSAVLAFGAGFAFGYLALAKAPAAVHLIVWNAAVVAVLLARVFGLLADVQRPEALDVDKLLYLPVSPAGAFLLNYLGSVFSLTVLVLVPGLVGLLVGQVFAGSLWMLLGLPLLAAFVLALTAVAYQFQGWLAALAADPRRQWRAFAFALVASAPLGLAFLYLVGTPVGWQGRPGATAYDLLADEVAAAMFRLAGKKGQYEPNPQLADRGRRELEEVEHAAWPASLVLPPGWVAVGAAGLAGGSAVPALLGTLGLGLIGVASLRRGYRTTVRLYTGAFTAHSRANPAPARPADPNRVPLVEWRLPWVSECASAVATATLRAYVRALEVRITLAGSVAMVVALVVACALVEGGPPAPVRPLLAYGVGLMALCFCGVPVTANQFGYDRAGFRALVLSPAPRHDILLGKNLASAAMALGAAVALALAVGVVYPMRIDHYPAVAAQLTAAYLLACVPANAMSIAAPYPVARGFKQPKEFRWAPVVAQLAFMCASPFILFPPMLPSGIAALVAALTGVRWLPVSLPLSLLMLAAAAWLYRAALARQGQWLQARERAVLDVVAEGF